MRIWAMRSPLRSRREMISPTRRRSTASGLQITRVRSAVVMAQTLGQRGPSSPYEVERAGDHNLTFGWRDDESPRHRLFHGAQGLDPAGVDDELEGGLGQFVGRHR